MMEVEKFDLIIQLLKKEKRLSYKVIASKTNISESSVRRYIDKMYTDGLLLKIKGGASISEKLNIDIEVKERFIQNISEKEEIAKKTSKLINDGDLIYLDAGTTIFFIIPYLKNRNITVVTNGIMHIDELVKYGIKTILIEGEVKHSTKAIIGVEAVNSISKYRFDKCFIGTNGIDVETGYTTPESNEARLKEKVIKHSEEKYILADYTKFNKISNISFGNILDCKIITNKRFDNKEYIKYIVKE